MASILALVHARTRRDFRRYKKTTIRRRVERRMGVHHIEQLGDYLQYLREQPGEVMQLFKDLLIGVTCFFREPDAWQALAHDLLAPLLEEHDRDAPLRIWVPGCATGEEPYSAAIVVLEQFAQLHKNCPVQIFATDINDTALELPARPLLHQHRCRRLPRPAPPLLPQARRPRLSGWQAHP